ncbi:phage holin [Rothia mucilaginosa]
MNSEEYNRAANTREFWYRLTAAITGLALGYGLLTPDKAQLWGALLVILLPNLVTGIMAMRNVRKAPPTVPAPEPVAVPSVEDIVASVVSGIAEMPAPAPEPVPRSDHGLEVQGVTSDAPVAN